MKKFFIFAIILLVTLSIVNAVPYSLLHKRVTTFMPCPVGFYPNPIKVSIQPDPPVSGTPLLVNVTGTLTEDYTIEAGTLLSFVALDVFDPIYVDFCTLNGITCPIPPGGSFSAVASFDLTGTLPAKYTIVVTIQVIIPIACAMGEVTGT
jgi:hypothetical protein